MKQLAYPKNIIRVTQPYKPLKNEHLGVDFGGVKVGDNRCWSVGKMLITNTGYNSVRGNFVEAYLPEHDMSCLYLHLSKILVHPKQNINDENVVVGMEGNTGNSTGAHLHFGLYKGKGISYYENHVNPLEYLYAQNEQHYYYGVHGNNIKENQIRRMDIYSDMFDPVKDTTDFYKKKLSDISEFIDEALKYGV